MNVVKAFGIAVVIINLVGGCSFPSYTENGKPISLTVGEGFKNPLGYYEAIPRFSWKPPSNSSTSTRQSAYQIQVASTFERLTTEPDKWDSSKIKSSAMSWILYKGKALSSREKIFWRVRFWDENDVASEWSDPAKLEVGLLENSDWKASWIGAKGTQISASPSQSILATPQYFRKQFSLDKSVRKARLYVTAKGVFKVFLNGEDITANDALPPGWTPYEKRIETLTYDVTSLLNQNENALGAIVAGGWYSGRIADLKETDHSKSPRFLAQLEITYSDNTTKVVTSNESWKSTQSGPIRFASNYDGERYDERFEMDDWASPEFDDSNWSQVITDEITSQTRLRPKRHLPVRNIKYLIPQSFEQVDKDTVIFDFGQNMVGVPSINIPVKEGKEVKLRFAEALHKGSFYTENYRSAHSTDYYLPAKDGIAEYTPSFTFHGFRYVEISGFDETKIPLNSWVVANVQHSDITLYRNFKSDNTKLNKLFENINWGLRGNFFDIPLDCPQRDERLGWTGDANAFITPSMYMADVYGFWSAYLESLREEQTKDGFVPLYVPFVKWINWTSSGWGDAATILPWELYMMTGDRKILEDSYPSMRAWIDYHESQAKDNISSMMTFGDWLQPYPEKEGKGANRGDTDFSLISTAFFARSVELTRKAALELGFNEDAKRLANKHEELAKAFRTEFFDKDLNVLKGKETQTAYLLALAFKLLPESDVKIAQIKLVSLLEASGTHLRTGFLGTPLLADVLQEAGRTDLVYALLFKETYPSWFYSINNGATTTWERWNSYSLEDGFNPQGMNSLNHYAYGTISRWFYEGILGVKPSLPGFKRAVISPQLTSQLGFAEGSIPTPNGTIDVSWTMTNVGFDISVTVPFNTTAEFIPPAHYKVEQATKSNGEVLNQWVSLTSGQYQFRLTHDVEDKGATL
ncbi:alpha-L-rhamnosidase [Alteromonas sp. KUL106]|uniref:alpha-L-rhamnosidase n=1 Tax=Alteromonas sp. KUL106 TaxID=2480799 RepID=UPI0012E4F55D|nr:alpha-L-rhamnosidase [Alteromonas sp. KUL106]GFD68680.1 alpha-L-rhamnosidase [Alteromonas sp. KUL106]